MKAPRQPKPRPLTFEERRGIGVMGQELYEYLLNFKKDQYMEMQKDGSLIPYLRKTGTELDDMVIDLMQNGMDEAGAKELARAEFNQDAAGGEIPDEELIL